MERPTTPVGLKDAWKEYPSIDNASGRVIKKVNPKVPTSFIFIFIFYFNKFLNINIYLFL
jgi:hypothetical protein